MYEIMIDGELFCDSRVQDLAIINPVLELAVNAAGSLRFTIPPAHPYYNMIKRRTSVIEVYRDEELLFQGFCVAENTDFYKQKTVECEGSMSYLNDSILRPQYYQGKTVRQLLESYITQHNAQTEEFKHFEVGMVDVADSNDYISCYTNYDSTMVSIKEDLVDDFGGYITVRYEEGKRYIDYIKESVNTNTQIIRLGDNLIDFQSNLDTTDICTVLIPLGASIDKESDNNIDTRVTIESVNEGKDYIVSSAVETLGQIAKMAIWDGVKTPEKLKEKAIKYLSDTQFEKVVIMANAIDLHYDNKDVEPFRLLDKIRVLSKPHGLDRYFVLTGMTLNLNNPEEDEVVLGGTGNVTISNHTAGINSSIDEKIDQANSALLNAAKDNATALINASRNGYLTLISDKNGNITELLIMDTNSIDTATKVWRWNINGLGYSDEGYKGTFKTAITMDGAIVADFITAGVMAADRIKGGTLTLGGYDDVNGIAQIKDANGKILVTLNKDGITLDDSVRISANNIKGGTLTLGGSTQYPADLQILNKKDEIIGRWTEKGLYSISSEIDYATYSASADFNTTDSTTNDEYETLGDFNDKYMYQLLTGLHKIVDGVMRVYIVLNNDDRCYLTINVVERYINDKNEGVSDLYQTTYSINKSTVNKATEKEDIEIVSNFLEDNPNVYYKDIYMPRLAMSNHSNSVIEIQRIEFGQDDSPTIAGIRFFDRVFQRISDNTYFDVPNIFVKNIIKKYPDIVSIDMVKNSIYLSNLVFKKNRIVLYNDADIVGAIPVSYSSNDRGVAQWKKNLVINQNGIMHKNIYAKATSTSGAKALYIDANGNIIASSSSKRYKEDITYDISQCNVRNLYELHPARFHYKHIYGGGDMELGFIAEDVAAVFPEAVMYNNSGLIESWNERKMIPALLALIQEQNERIKKLEGKVLKDG